MTKEELDQLYAEAYAAEEAWLEDDTEMLMPPPIVLALVRELEATQHESERLVRRVRTRNRKLEEELSEADACLAREGRRHIRARAWAKLWKRLAKRYRPDHLTIENLKMAQVGVHFLRMWRTLQAIAEHPDCPESIAKLAQETLTKETR